MEGISLTHEEYARFKKYQEKEAKQKRYQQVQNAKTNLRAKWAKLNGCPISKRHAEFYADLDEQRKDSMSLDEIMRFADSQDIRSEATAHAVTELQKEQSAETNEDSSALRSQYP